MDFVLLLVTILLVLIAAVTLLIGIFGDNLALIFVSIGASAAAAVVLAVLSQISRRTSREEASRSQTPGLEPATPAPAAQPVGAAAPEAPEPAAPAPAAATTAATTAVSATAAAVPVAELPISGYDQLRVAEILPRLDDLDLDELEEVAQHEETTKNRATILNRIDELMDQLEAVEPVAASGESSAADVDVMPVDADVVPAVAASGLPIADYDALDGDEVIPLLADLDAEALEAVAEYEETHANRDRVLDAIDDRLDELEGIGVAAAAPTPVTPAVGPLPARKTASKKAAVRSTKTTKATLPLATAKKAVSKKAVSKKATAKKATAEKTTAKKTSATAAATKAVAKNAPTPAAKRPPTGPVAKRTATATKASKAAKKATKTTKASKRI